jgi:hypothetical protein
MKARLVACVAALPITTQEPGMWRLVLMPFHFGDVQTAELREYLQESGGTLVRGSQFFP